MESTKASQVSNTVENDDDSAEHLHESSQNLPSEGNNIPEDTESQEESQIHNENLICRFYRKDFPEENDIVLVSFSTPSVIPLPHH